MLHVLIYLPSKRLRKITLNTFNILIMKTFKLLLYSVASALILAGCTENEENFGDPSINVDPAELSFGTEAASNTVTLVATRDWTAAVEPSDADWITVEPAFGDASTDAQTVTVTVLENAGANRSATVTFAANNGMVSTPLEVTQTGSVETSYATIASVRELAPASTDATATIPDGTKVKGYVVLGSDLNNATSLKNIYIQDESAGIQIRFTSNSDLKFGDEIELDLSGQELAYFSEALQINNLPNANASVLSSANEITPVEVSMADFLANKYEGRYVSLSGVQVVDSDLEKTFVMNGSHTSIRFEDADGNNFVVFSSKYSTYGSTQVPQGSGVLKGVSTKNYDDIQIMFARESDFAGLDGARFDGAGSEPVNGSISDVINAEEGVQVSTEGFVAGLYKSGLVITDGTDNLLVYNGQSGFVAPDFKIGDKVSVSGSRASFGELPQIAASYEDITLISSGNGVNYPHPEVIDASNIATFDKSECSYIQYTGTLSISGNYYNVEIAGSSVQGSLSYPLDELNLSQYEGKEAIYTGYYCGGTNEKYLNMLVVRVESDGTGEEDPEEPVDPDSPYVSNVTWSLGPNSYNEEATVNGEGPVDVVKIGKSKTKGSIDITIPSGTTQVNFYAVSWNSETATLSFVMNGKEVASQSIAKNAGAANSQPYTFTVTESDYYTFKTPMPLPTDMTITVTTQENARAILWGIKAVSE